MINASDVPRENLFMVGIISKETTRDLFHLARPRRPFVVARAEALNLIGYLITHADFTVADIENAIRDWNPQVNLFDVQGDDKRVHIAAPSKTRIYPRSMSEFERDALLASAEMGLFLFTMEEAKILCASLVHVMGLQPKEVEAGVIAIFEHSRNPSGFGQGFLEMLKS